MTPKETAILLALGGAAVVGAYLLKKRRTFEKIEMPVDTAQIYRDITWQREQDGLEAMNQAIWDDMFNPMKPHIHSGAAEEYFGITINKDLNNFDLSSQKKLMGI